MFKMKWALLVLLIACSPKKSTYKNSYHIENDNFEEQAKSSKVSSISKEELQQINPVLLISLDGYRFDYTAKYRPKFISQFAKEGAQLKSLISSYPTKTFPNHLSIVTGRYPMNHGIVANSFYAPELKLSYSLKDRKAVGNSDFYLATPIWTAAEEQGLRTATLFWPGSEAEISGKRPTYWYEYIHSMPHQDRIAQIVEWMKLPIERRPSFTTLYFPDVDSAGHHHGVESQEVKDAIIKVDRSLEELVTKVRGIIPNINIIIVSDHGMKDVDENKKELILKTSKLHEIKEDYRIYGAGPIVQFYLKQKGRNIKADIVAINSKAQNFKCYSKSETPTQLNFNSNPRVGDIACIAKSGYWIAATDFKFPKATHGWDQFSDMSMHGIFYAQGPDFKKNFIAESKSNIHIFPLLLRLLGLDNQYTIDGDIEKIKEVINL